MKDQINQAWYLKNRRTGFLGLFFCFLFQIFSFSTFSQTDFYFSSKNLSSSQLLISAGDKIDKPFNFIEDKLPKGSFTFSFNGTESQFLELLSDVLNRKMVPLGDSLVAVQIYLKYDQLEDVPSPKTKNKILDTEGMPMIGCNIWSTKLKLGAQTNELGYFEIEGHFAKNEMFAISYIGYEELIVPFELLSANKPIVLQTKSHELGEVIVTDYVSPLNEDLDRMNLATDKIAAVGVGDQDALALAQLLPGVYNSAESLNFLQIRGGPPDQVSYRWNSIQVYQNSLFYGHISAINPYMIDRVAITKNGASAKEQSNASGNISMSNDLKRVDTTEIKLHADFLYTNIGFQSSLFKNKLKIQSAFRKSIAQKLRGNTYNNIYNSIFQYGKVPDLDYYFQKYDLEGIIRWENDFSFNDFSASAQLELSPKLSLQVDYLIYGNEYDLRRIHTYEPAVENDNLKLNSVGLSGNLKYRWHDKFQSTLKAARSEYTFDFKFFADEQDPSTINREQVNTVLNETYNWDNQYENDWLRLNAGYMREHWDANYTDLLDKAIYYQDGKKSFEDAVYLESKLKIGKQLVLDAGLRVSKYSRSLNEELYWEPRIHLSYLVLPALSIHAHYGDFHQVLTKRTGYSPLLVENEFWHLSDQRFDTQNWINVIQNKQWSGGLDFEKNKWLLSFDFYQKEIKNIWTASLDFSVEEDPFRFADMSVSGIEFSAGYQKKSLLMLLTMIMSTSLFRCTNFLRL